MESGNQFGDRAWGHRYAGQALIEFTVGLAALLLVIAGIVQLGQMTAARTRCVIAARQAAGAQALRAAPAWAAPEYVAAVTAGPDRREYSRDDDFAAGNPGVFQGRVLGAAQPVVLARYAPGNRLSALALGVAPQAGLGLVYGEATEVVELLPVVRTLVYRHDAVEVAGKVWLTWTQGVY